jgi:hypothetical protein
MSTPIPTQTPNAARPKRSRIPLLLIAFCFFAPVVAAWFLQSPLSSFRPAPTKNQGELISPVVAINQAQFETVQSVPRGNWEAQWTLLYLPSPSCGSCEERLKLIAHIRQAAGREMERVNLQILSTRRFSLPPEAKFSTALASDTQWQPLLQSVGLKPDGGLVILDPLGNAVMRFPADFDGNKVRKDLMRLLKVSQTGKTQSTGIIG